MRNVSPHPSSRLVETGATIAPSFLIVGTPRSGTTLIQRFACELSGVRVPPETHFFRAFAGRLLARRSFPLAGSELRAEVEAFGRLGTSRGIGLDVDAVMELLDGHCSSVLDLFGAVVRQIAGPATTYGEKTPSHLRWWRPLTAASTGLKIIAVVRDPRAVVASALDTPWGRRGHVVLAQQWSIEQRQVLEAGRTLGNRRCLTVRYEDAVTNAGGTRRAIATFLGTDDRPPGTTTNAQPMFLEWESWKARATGPVTTDRIDAWRRLLEPRQAAQVSAICRRGMVEFGYGRDPASVSASWLQAARIPPASQYRRARAIVARHRQLHRINSITL